MSSSSSHVPEKILAAANNQRLLVTRSGLAVALVASLNGGLVVSEDQAAVINSAMEVATYNFRHSKPENVSVAGPDLVARTLGVRLRLIEFRGSRASIGSPVEISYGPQEGPDVKLITLESKARSAVEYFSFVGPSFNNDLLTQNDTNAILRIIGGNEPQVQFAALLQTDGEVLPEDTTVPVSTVSNSSLPAVADEDINNSNKMATESNSDTVASGATTSLQVVLAELASLRQQVNQRSPMTPVRMGSMSEVMSPMYNSQASFSSMGYNAAIPIYLEKFTSAEVKAWRQKMMMHAWPMPYYKYVHYTLFDYVKGQWNVYVDNATRDIPRFEDSGTLPSDNWFDILEELVAEIKFDEEGVVAPTLQVSSHNGLPIYVDSFMQILWKWLHRQERFYSKPSIRLQIVATLEKCPCAKRVIEIHNMRLAEEDAQYPPRKLVSKVNEVITNLSTAGQHVTEFIKKKNHGTGFPPKSQKGVGSGAGAGAGNGGGAGKPCQKLKPKDGKGAEDSKEIKDLDSKDAKDTKKPPFKLVCHDCGVEGHKRGDRLCKKFNKELESKRKREESPGKSGKK